MIHKQVGNRILEFFNSVCKLTWFSLSSKRNKVKLSIYLVYSLKVYLQILFNIRILEYISLVR